MIVGCRSVVWLGAMEIEMVGGWSCKFEGVEAQKAVDVLREGLVREIGRSNYTRRMTR